MRTFAGRHSAAKLPKITIPPKRPPENGLILAEVIGYYGLIGAAAIGAVFIH